MDEEFLINIVIAGKKYPLTIKRHEEELARAAAAFCGRGGYERFVSHGGFSTLDA